MYPKSNIEIAPGFFDLNGREVQFYLSTREGKQHATDVILVPTANMPVVGTMKSYNDQKGSGFMDMSSLEGQDAFFAMKDMPPHMHAFDGPSKTGARV